MIQGLKNILSEMGGEMERFCLALETPPYPNFS